MKFWTVLIAFLCFQYSVNCEEGYTAAVYEHVTAFFTFEVTPSRNDALQIMQKNLAVYSVQAAKARAKGAQIIVFPEDGLYGFLAGNKRSDIFPFLEDIPDASGTWNPCTNPNRFKQTEVLQTLSCIARNNSIAVVANMGDVKKCTKTDPNCPKDGRYQYNTDVVFDTDGKLIARYHKQHLFYEGGFNTPAKCEHVTFITSFGVRFGVFTCFDMLYADPALDLVHLGVCNIVFPTAWMDALPLLAAVEYQQAWSRQTCTNLLAANQDFPLAKMQGSGIYSCGEAKTYVRDDASMQGHLLVATVPLLAKVTYGYPSHGSACVRPGVKNGQPVFSHQSPPQIGDQSPATFQSLMLHDLYTFEKLETPSGKLTICSEELCCQATYSIKNSAVKEKEMYAFGVFSGTHHKDGYFIQVCALIKCADIDQKSCGQSVKEANTVFESFEIKGNFSAKATVFPEVLSNNVELVSPSFVKFEGFSLSSKAVHKPLLSAVLYGRVYTRDKKT